MSLVATIRQEARVAYPNMFDKFELRGQKYGLLDLALENAKMPQGIISPDLMAKAKKSWGQALKIPVMTGASAANGTGLSCTFSGTEAISAHVAVTFVTISNGFLMRPALNAQNDISYEQEFARKYTDMVRKIASAIDVVVDSTLTTNIAATAEYSSSYIGTKYPMVADKMQVSLANQPNYFNDLLDILAADDLEDQEFDVVGSTNMRGIVQQIFSQGAGNQTNTSYQFNTGDWDFKYSNRVVLTPTTSNATGFVMPKGSVAMISRNSPDCLAKSKIGEVKFWDTMFDPTLGVELDTLYEPQCADISATTTNADDTAALLEGFQFAAHYAILTPYSNFATSGVSSVIRKFDLLNT